MSSERRQELMAMIASAPPGAVIEMTEGEMQMLARWTAAFNGIFATTPPKNEDK